MNKLAEQKQSSYFIKYTYLLILIAIFSLLYILIHFEFFYKKSVKENITLNDIILGEIDESFINERTYYLVYDNEDEVSVNYLNNISNTLEDIKINYSVVDVKINILPTEDDVIIFIVRDWYKYIDKIDDFLESVRTGTSILFANLPSADNSFMNYRSKLGIIEFASTSTTSQLIFTDEMLIGANLGESLQFDFMIEYSYILHLTKDTNIYLKGENEEAIFYTRDYGKGTIGVYNGELLTGGYYEGILLGALTTISDTFAYPIVNSKVIFLDDFPAPHQLFIDTSKDDYNYSSNEYIQYVWWPDIKSTSKRFGVEYTSSYVLVYNDKLSGDFNDEFSLDEFDIFKYSKELVSNDSEMGIHGYNHFPLYFGSYEGTQFEGIYDNWNSVDDARRAFKHAVDVMKQLFPAYNIHSYVAPSNVIDMQGVKIVKEVLGEPVIISDLYNNDTLTSLNKGFKYEDGVIYFPRFSSGFIFDAQMQFNIMNGVNKYGIFSHFIHPDDVAATERSGGKSWEQLRISYNEYLEYMDEKYSSLDYLRVSDAAKRLMIWDQLEIKIEYNYDHLSILTNSGERQYSLYIKSKTPLANGIGYEVKQINENLYLVNASKDRIKITYLTD